MKFRDWAEKVAESPKSGRRETFKFDDRRTPPRAVTQIPGPRSDASAANNDDEFCWLLPTDSPSTLTPGKAVLNFRYESFGSTRRHWPGATATAV